MADLNPLFDPATDNAVIDPATQQILNQPLKAEAFTAEEQAFLDLLMAKIADKTINLYSPSSLLNTPVYDALPTEAKGLADQNAFVLLANVREINNLMQVSQEPTYQVKNLVDSLFQTKKRLEEHGDIFII
jgi:hypothetical protein